jgi:hypothetical protein
LVLFSLLAMEPRVLSTLGKSSTSEPHPQSCLPVLISHPLPYLLSRVHPCPSDTQVSRFFTGSPVRALPIWKMHPLPRHLEERDLSQGLPTLGHISCLLLNCQMSPVMPRLRQGSQAPWKHLQVGPHRMAGTRSN